MGQRTAPTIIGPDLPCNVAHSPSLSMGVKQLLARTVRKANALGVMPHEPLPSAPVSSAERGETYDCKVAVDDTGNESVLCLLLSPVP